MKKEKNNMHIFSWNVSSLYKFRTQQLVGALSWHYHNAGNTMDKERNFRGEQLQYLLQLPFETPRAGFSVSRNIIPFVIDYALCMYEANSVISHQHSCPYGRVYFWWKKWLVEKGRTSPRRLFSMYDINLHLETLTVA